MIAGAAFGAPEAERRRPARRASSAWNAACVGRATRVMLTAEEERAHVVAWQQTGCRKALTVLVEAHFPLIVRMARHHFDRTGGNVNGDPGRVMAQRHARVIPAEAIEIANRDEAINAMLARVQIADTLSQAIDGFALGLSDRDARILRALTDLVDPRSGAERTAIAAVEGPRAHPPASARHDGRPARPAARERLRRRG